MDDTPALTLAEIDEALAHAAASPLRNLSWIDRLLDLRAALTREGVPA